TTTIIPLDGKPDSSSGIGKHAFESSFARAPWFPFRTRADFELAEMAVKGRLNSGFTEKLIKGATGEWSKSESCVTFERES
ncbi:hypothetical protein R3P38DRAFT_2579449, partial [Favolaschia claudopus]